MQVIFLLGACESHDSARDCLKAALVIASWQRKRLSRYGALDSRQRS